MTTTPTYFLSLPCRLSLIRYRIYRQCPRCSLFILQRSLHDYAKVFYSLLLTRVSSILPPWSNSFPYISLECYKKKLDLGNENWSMNSVDLSYEHLTLFVCPPIDLFHVFTFLIRKYVNTNTYNPLDYVRNFSVRSVLQYNLLVTSVNIYKTKQILNNLLK